MPKKQIVFPRPEALRISNFNASVLACLAIAAHLLKKINK